MRGPYSAPAIEKRTSPPGSKHYRGWHNLGWALLFYTRTAQVVAAAWETGFAVMAAALAGLWIALRRRIARASLLLWVPLAFYVYSVAYGSVPIFIPQLYPHSYYNARYGMELLPALALFACAGGGGDGAADCEGRAAACRADAALDQCRAAGFPVRPLYLVVLALVLVNPLAMVYGTALVQRCAQLIERHPSNLLANYAPPLVLKEALVNSTTRVPFERNLALVLEDLPPGAPILMQESDHIGALQDAGIPLRQTINESDYDSWHAALAGAGGAGGVRRCAGWRRGVEGGGGASRGIAGADDSVRDGAALRADLSVGTLCGSGRANGEVISFAAVVLPSQRRENAYDCDLTDSLQHD